MQKYSRIFLLVSNEMHSLLHEMKVTESFKILFIYFKQNKCVNEHIKVVLLVMDLRKSKQI